MNPSILEQICARVRPTICETFSFRTGTRIEGRISKVDFETLVALVADALEEAAQLHESINPASDDERHHHVPGAGAMGALIEYREAIRKLLDRVRAAIAKAEGRT